MMCMAIYIKKYLKITDDLAFISPCVAKKAEITDANNHGYVKYNVTFAKLMQHIGRDYAKSPEYTDELEYGMGSLYPMPGGLRENVDIAEQLRLQERLRDRAAVNSHKTVFLPVAGRPDSSGHHSLTRSALRG